MNIPDEAVITLYPANSRVYHPLVIIIGTTFLRGKYAQSAMRTYFGLLQRNR